MLKYKFSIPINYYFLQLYNSIKSLITYMTDSKTYWNKFYRDTLVVKRSSNFSLFVIKKIKKNSDMLLDVGCGNGRDTFFFIRNKVKTFGIDQSSTIINENNKIKKVFFNINFCKKRIILKNKFNVFYARFFLHSITLIEEKKFFKNIKLNSRPESRIFLEFRTDKDPLIKQGTKISKYERFTDHYRRFINVTAFEKRVKNEKFDILFLKTSNKFSIFKDDKPDICRVILSWKNN